MKTKSPTKTNINNLTLAASKSLPGQASSMVGVPQGLCIYGGIDMCSHAPWQNFDDLEKKRQRKSEDFMRIAIFVTCLIGILYLSINCIIQDKRNEVKHTKIFKNQVLAYLPENAAVNCPKAEVSR
jgi:hypothetical protein